ncbi:MAG: nucleotide exchange factor GrpE [Ilumatobacter sp.]|nr:nucleotide exchange factor GrpE [Ilumatobacter sp.]
MTDAPTPDDPTAGEEFAPFDDTELLADLTSEMSRPRPLAGEEAGGPLGDDVLLGDAAAVAAAEADVADDVAALLAERDQFKDIALRLQADFDNYRKRMATQQADEVQRATGKMAEALLPVLDACEAAFVQHPAEVEPVFNLLLGELRKLGLEGMNLLEQPFDPNLAEAVMHEPGDGAETVVSEVLRSGYTWKGRVLRAAMVKVRG